MVNTTQLVLDLKHFGRFTGAKALCTSFCAVSVYMLELQRYSSLQKFTAWRIVSFLEGSLIEEKTG